MSLQMQWLNQKAKILYHSIYSLKLAKLGKDIWVMVDLKTTCSRNSKRVFKFKNKSVIFCFSGKMAIDVIFKTRS